MVVVMKINRKNFVPPIPGGLVVESARRYECRSVQSAQEYIMYLDTYGLTGAGFDVATRTLVVFGNLWMVFIVTISSRG